MDLSVVIVTWNTRELVEQCVESLLSELDNAKARFGVTAEVIVVDNGSIDGTAALLAKRFPAVTLIRLEENRGFAAGNNPAFRHARGRAILLLNSDCFMPAASISRCIEVLRKRTDAGAVGPQLRYPDGRLQRSAHEFPGLYTESVPRILRDWISTGFALWNSSRVNGPVSVPALRGAALMVRREVIETIGPLCEDYFFFLEETDWCWRMRQANWVVLQVADATALHQLGQSSKRVWPLRTRIEFHRSLYRFVALRKGPLEARAVCVIRVLRALGTAGLVLPAALFSGRYRQKLASRLGLLGWHLRGRPAEAGLVGAGPGRPRLDCALQKGKAPGSVRSRQEDNPCQS